jgi:maltose/moltooligosaccharide transporter
MTSQQTPQEEISMNTNADQSKPDGLRLNWGFTFLIGLGFFGIELLWRVYNSFVPIYLQSGSTAFDAHQSTPLMGFGLNTFASGIVMGLDNLAALFLLPAIGVISDRTFTRIGRRMPFILIFAPIAALSFALIPLAPSMITAETNGDIGAMQGIFALFMILLGIMLLAMAAFRTPVISLMPDLTPSPLRSKANGAINFMGGLAGVVGTLALSPLFDVNPWIPFIAGAVILIGAVIALFALVKERKASVVLDEEGKTREGLNIIMKLREVPAANQRTLTFLMLAIFFWFVAFNGLDTWFTSFGVTVLGLTAGRAGMIFSVALIAFILFAIPAGFIGTRYGRRWTIFTGLAIFTVILIIINALQSLTAIIILLAVGGASWALVNINSLPMVVDTSTDERMLGTYTGLYYIASQLAAIFGPAIIGWVVDLSGGDFRKMFVVVPVFFGLAMFSMLFVTRGEAKAVDARGRAIE